MSRTALLFRIAGDLHRVEGHSAVAGRSRECDIRCDERGVSRRHAEIVMDIEGVTVRDLGSKHGTWVHEKPVKGERRIRVGSVVRLGRKGPRIELAGALMHGKKLSPDGREFLESKGRDTASEAPRAAPPPKATGAAIQKPAAARSQPQPKPARPAATTTGSFGTASPSEAPPGLGKGMAWGIATGLLVGLVMLTIVDCTPWITAARRALGL